MKYNQNHNPPAPIATVKLRNSQTLDLISNVPMLLDTGADVTLLPQQFCEQIGVAISDTEYLELEGFNETKSIFFYVHLDLIFLNKLFRGNFLVINQAEGIIGRDLLNQFAILFDGINLEWNMQN